MLSQLRHSCSTLKFAYGVFSLSFQPHVITEISAWHNMLILISSMQWSIAQVLNCDHLKWVSYKTYQHAAIDGKVFLSWGSNLDTCICECNLWKMTLIHVLWQIAWRKRMTYKQCNWWNAPKVPKYPVPSVNLIDVRSRAFKSSFEITIWDPLCLSVWDPRVCYKIHSHCK